MIDARTRHTLTDVIPAVAVVETAAAIAGGISDGIGAIAGCMLFRCR